MEKLKSMLIGGTIGAGIGAGVAYAMKKTDVKNMAIYSGAGLALGLLAGYLLGGGKAIASIDSSIATSKLGADDTNKLAEETAKATALAKATEGATA